MARRKSIIEDLMDLVSELPWAIGVGLALLSYAVLHATGTFLQFAVPVIFLAGAVAGRDWTDPAADMSTLQRLDDGAHRKTRRKRRRQVLGLQAVSEMPGHIARLGTAALFHFKCMIKDVIKRKHSEDPI